MSNEEDVVIYDSSLTLEQLKGFWSYMRDEEVDEEAYNKLKSLVPDTVDWENFKEYDDNVEGVQTLSCTAGGCEI